MDLDFTPEQQQIRHAVRRFLEQECPPSLVRRMREERASLPRDIWRRMAELGWLGLPFAANYGGTGSDFVTLGALMEELGRACDPTPFADCVLTCGWLIQDLGSERQKQRWLPPLIGGELRLSLAHHEEQAILDPGGAPATLSETAGFLRLRGQKIFVEHAADADLLLVSAVMAGTGEPCLALISPRGAGVELTPLRSLAYPDIYEVRFRNAPLAPDQLLGQGPGLQTRFAAVVERTAAFQSAAAAGGARRVLEMAIDHAKRRQQFGKPIGSFQAVQHLLANAWTEVETAWLAAYEALVALETNLPTAADKVAIAKCASNETFVRTCFTAHQVFGGMGYMWETDLHLWTRKAKEIEVACGGLQPYRRRLTASL